MKKHFVVLAALLLVVAVAMPAFAAVEFKYGGEFRARLIANDNNLNDSQFLDGWTGAFPGPYSPISRSLNDNQVYVDQRMRLYFTFIASENLRVVTKFEIGDINWGRSGNRVGASSGGQPGADAVNVETKNVYIEFNIPNTPVTANVGIQGLNLLSSWIVDDDFAAAILRAKFDPVIARLGYVAGGIDEGINDTAGIRWTSRIDSWFLALDYKDASCPFSGSLIGYYQFGHDTMVSADPAVMWTPSSSSYADAGLTGGPYSRGTTPYGVGSIPAVAFATAPTVGGVKKDNYWGSSVLFNQFQDRMLFATLGAAGVDHLKDNNLFDLGINLQYKIDWVSAYLNFVKNLGGTDIYDAAETAKLSADYTGFMIDGGATFFCGPYTFNIGGFYTTGDEQTIVETDNTSHVGHLLPTYGVSGYKNSDIDRFVFPRSTQKYFSEIIGGGILDNNQNIAHTNRYGVRDYQWEGYGWPSNIWTVTVGGSWQALEKTKLSGSYWYFGTSQEVLGKGGYAANDIGHELDFYLTQGIVDGLNLDLVAAYLIKGDAYTAAPSADDAFELGARLIWSF